MHAFRSTDDGINRAGLNALGAADAFGFADNDYTVWLQAAMLGVQWFGGNAKQQCQCANSRIATGGALVDVGMALSDGFGIRPATAVVTLPTLRLRQQAIDVFGRWPARHGLFDRVPGLRARIGIEQEQALFIAGGKNHPFRNPKTHFARGQIGDEYHIAANELIRLAITATYA